MWDLLRRNSQRRLSMNLNVAGTELPLLDMVHLPMLLRQVSHLGHRHQHHRHHDHQHHHHHHHQHRQHGKTSLQCCVCVPPIKIEARPIWNPIVVWPTTSHHFPNDPSIHFHQVSPHEYVKSKCLYDDQISIIEHAQRCVILLWSNSNRLPNGQHSFLSGFPQIQP